MNHGLPIALALGVMLTGSAVPVLASERAPAGDGVRITQPRSDQYCVRVITLKAQERWRLPLHRPVCKSAARWDREGVHLWRGGQRIAVRM